MLEVSDSRLRNRTSFENTYFTALLGDHSKWKPDSDGSYFIDRDPEGFAAVLNYLRGQDDVLSRLKPELIPSFQAHLDYLLIPGPNAKKPGPGNQKQSPWNLGSISTGRVLLQGNTVSKGSASVQDAGVGGVFSMRLILTQSNPISVRVKGTSLGSGSKGEFGLVYFRELEEITVPHYIALGSKENVCHYHLDRDSLGTRIVSAKRKYATIPKNPVIEMKVDSSTREVRFVMNDKDYGVAVAIPEDVQEYFGFVVLIDETHSFEFLDSQAH